jgi:hypothetical protein
MDRLEVMQDFRTAKIKESYGGLGVIEFCQRSRGLVNTVSSCFMTGRYAV